MKRLLDGIEHSCAGLRQIAGEIAQERSLAESSFVAVEDDARRGGWRRERLGERRIILSRIRGPRRDVDESRDLRIDTDSVTIMPEKECPTSTVGPSGGRFCFRFAYLMSRYARTFFDSSSDSARLNSSTSAMSHRAGPRTSCAPGPLV